MAPQAMVGTTDERLNKTIVETIRSVESSQGVSVNYVEDQNTPGDLPKVPATRSRSCGKTVRAASLTEYKGDPARQWKLVCGSPS